jgi:serine/threonine-protein kinase
MSEFLSSVRQRKLVQWALAYLAGAWVAVEVVDVLADTWGWSTLVPRVVFVVLMAGFGLTLVLSWYHGEKGRQRVSGLEAGLLAVVVLAGGAGVGMVLRTGGPTAESPIQPRGASALQSLAVLPFTDLSPDGASAYLGEGIAETLINELGRVERLRVVARTSAFAFKDREMDVREIAEVLGVGAVVEGSVVQVGRRVRITANLVDGATGTALWVDRFDRSADASDLFELQDEVARQILAGLQVELAGGEPVVRAGSSDREAQQAYFLGQHHWTARTSEDMVLAARYFREAIEEDSLFADAWAGLALTRVLQTPSEYPNPEVSREQALEWGEAAALRALELDPENAAAFAALGEAYWQAGEMAAAEESFRRAIAINPSYATAHHWLADLLMATLRGEEALEEMTIAEALSPVAPAILVEKAQALMIVGRNEEADAQMQKASTLLPDAVLVHNYGFWLYGGMGDWDRAAFHLARAAILAGVGPGEAQRLEADFADPDRRGEYFRVVARGGTAELGLTAALRATQFDRPEALYLAVREVEGVQPALDRLEEEARGPGRDALYWPILPALFGPELNETEQVARIMSLARND